MPLIGYYITSGIFKMAGPKRNFDAAWGLVRKGLTLDDPTPLGRYLGCDHQMVETKSPITGKTVRAIKYVKGEFSEACGEVFVTRPHAVSEWI